jgi:iron complex outermembrane recepter protein
MFTKTPLALAVSGALAALMISNVVYAQTAPAAAAAPAKAETAAEKAAREAREKAAAEKKAEEERVRQGKTETIIVTATGRSQSASTVPYNVTAITEEQLRDENITDVKKLIQESVSINAPGNSARFADSVSVRGLNVSSVTANNLEQFVRTTLAYYLDSTPLPNIGYRIKDIARVETLLGPQGTLYGAGSLGGTVRYITNQPKLGVTEGRLTTSMYQTRGGGVSTDTDIMFNAPISNSMAVRFSLAALDEAGYTDRVSNPPWRTGTFALGSLPDPNVNVYKDDDWQRVTGGRVSLLWKLTNDFRVTFSHAEQKQRANGTSGTSLTPLRVANAQTPTELLAAWRAGSGSFTSACVATNTCRFTSQLTTPPAVAVDTVISRYPEFANRNFKLDSIDFDWDLKFARLTSSTSQFEDRRKGEADYLSQGEIFYFRLGDAGGRIDSGRTAYITFDNFFKGLSHETRLTSQSSGPLSWIAGVYHTDQDRSFRFSEYLPGGDVYNGINRTRAGGNVDELYRENLARKYKETALYGEVGYKIVPQWLTTVGARFFNYKDTGIGEIRDYSFDLVNNNVNKTGGENGKSYFKFNTSYQFNRDFLAYFTASQGFRRGGTNPFRDVGTLRVSAENREYKPDSTNNYELGAKGQFLDGALYVQGAIYQIDWKDPQTDRAQDIEGFPVNGTANAADARTRGAEMQMRYRFLRNWQVRYNAAYTEGEFVDTKTNCLYEGNTTRECRTWGKGGKLGGGPRWKHNGSFRFNTNLDGGMYVWAQVSARYVGRVPVSRTDAEEVQQLFRPAYVISNFNAGLSKGAWDVNFWVQNLADKREVVSSQVTGNTTGTAGDLSGARVIYTTPRTIGTTITYNFQ